MFLTGGTSFVPAVRRLFADRFGVDKLEFGGELVSIATKLALMAVESDLEMWTRRAKVIIGSFCYVRVPEASVRHGLPPPRPRPGLPDPTPPAALKAWNDRGVSTTAGPWTMKRRRN